MRMIVKQMKKALLCLVAAVVLLSGIAVHAAAVPEVKLTAPAPAKAENKISSDTVIMKINGEPVKEAQLDELVQAMLNEFLSQFGGMVKANSLPPEILENARIAGIKRLKDQVLLDQAVKAAKIEPTPAQIDDEMATMEARMKIFKGDDVTLKGEIAKAAAENKAMSEAELTGRIKDQCKIQLQLMTVIEKETGGHVTPTPEDVKAIYDKDPSRWARLHAAHILIESKPSQGTVTQVDKEALDKAKKVLEEARAAKDFGEVAKKNSADPGSAKEGGDLGYFTFEKMDPAFSKAAFALKPGQISELVQTRFGYHIIKAIDLKQVALDDPKNTVDTRRRIILAERNVKLPVLYPEAVQSLAKKAKIEDLVPMPKPAEKAPESDIKVAPIAPKAGKKK